MFIGNTKYSYQQKMERQKDNIKEFESFMEKVRLVKAEHKEQAIALMLYMGFVNKIDYCLKISEIINNNKNDKQILNSEFLFKDKSLQKLQSIKTVDKSIIDENVVNEKITAIKNIIDKEFDSSNVNVLEAIIRELGIDKTIELSIIFTQIVMFARAGERWEKIDNTEILNILFLNKDIQETVKKYREAENKYIREENEKVQIKNKKGESNVFVLFGSTYINMENRLIFLKELDKYAKNYDFNKVKDLIILTGFRPIVGNVGDVFNCFNSSSNLTMDLAQFQQEYGVIINNLKTIKNIDTVFSEIDENKKIFILENIKLANKYVYELRQKYNSKVVEYNDNLEKIDRQENYNIEDINKNDAEAVKYFKNISETDLAFMLAEKYNLINGEDLTIINCNKIDEVLQRATTDTTLECIGKHIQINKDKYINKDVYFISNESNVKAQGVAVDYYLPDVKHHTIGAEISKVSKLSEITQQIASCLRLAVRLYNNEELLNKFNNKQYEYKPTLLNAIKEFEKTFDKQHVQQHF